jgi:hypothetical protein
VWSVTDLAELLGGTAQDLEVTATIGPNGITVVTEDRGNGTDGGYGKRLSVAVTRDGVTWQTWDLGDLVGREPMGRHLVTVDYVGDQIVVDVGVLPEGASMPTFGPGSALSMVPPPSERVSLVGTPR